MAYAYVSVPGVGLSLVPVVAAAVSSGQTGTTDTATEVTEKKDAKQKVNVAIKIAKVCSTFSVFQFSVLL